MIVVLESPYHFNCDKEHNMHMLYLCACLDDSLKRGESPFASHGLYTLCLDDNNPQERELGISAGLEFYKVSEKCVVYVDHGISTGMERGIERAKELGVPVEYRRML